MSTTHVFIVDSNTFQYHLQYLFAGTGAKDNYIDFNNSSSTKILYRIENNLVSMISDSQRIRKGDFIVFYLQQNFSKNVKEGKFYGIFKAKEDLSFLDNNDDKQYLKEKLGKSLTFRTLIEPFEVYSKGVTEWEALDEIKNIQSPNQMLWSLIYRKLKGNRGNTMITIYESERLFKLIRDKNYGKTLNGKNFTFDIQTQEIVPLTDTKIYEGRKEIINILPRLIEKFKNNKAFEAHLQAYIVQNIGRNVNINLDTILLSNNYTLEWLGNEVSCGVGMQKIDIMLSLENKTNSTRRIIMPIEIKSIAANSENLEQIQRYINWIEQYYIPNRISDIQPVLLTFKLSNNNYRELFIQIEQFNKNNPKCMPLKFVVFEINNDSLKFEEIEY